MSQLKKTDQEFDLRKIYTLIDWQVKETKTTKFNI